jgi:hypothetical protein
MPAAIGGKWYIYYKGSFPWSHFEAPAAKSSTSAATANIEIYPNPVGQILHIRSHETISHLQIIDYTGKIVKNYQLTNTIYDIDMSDLPSGSYLLRITSEKSTYHKQLVKF